MAETKKPKKVHKIISATDGTQIEKSTAAKPAAATETVQRTVKDAKPVGNAGALRIGAVVLWVAAILFEIVGFLIVNGTITLSFMPTLYQIIAVIVLDLLCVIIGAQLWKKANHIAPASEANKAKFWLWNNMGVIVCVVAFVPFVILLLTNKNLDKKTKAIASVVAVVALLIGGVSSYDFNPVSVEQQTAAVSALGETTVYWTQFGKVYHTHEDCQALNQSDTLTQGTVDQAIAANRTRLCAFCAKQDDIQGVVTNDDATALAVAAPAQDSSLAPAA
ncbi:MAG: hypothetical protein RSA17_10235 [Ruthenibacterium sp.]